MSLKDKFQEHRFIYICIIILFVIVVVDYFTPQKINDDGVYDYCVEWDGYIDRDNMIYNCYDLTKLEFTCDYKIFDDGRLMTKPILNITKNKEGLITSITYGNATYHNCTRWLKSKG